MSDAKMVTFSGVVFDLLEPRVEDIELSDIAHALARLNRFTGHTRGGTLSVAQHSVLVDGIVQWMLGAPNNGTVNYFRGPALLHDAHEAYTGDISTPMKRALTDHSGIVKSVQRNIQRAIDERFGVADFDRPAVKDIVKKADVIALFLERVRWTAGSPGHIWPAPHLIPPTGWNCDIFGDDTADPLYSLWEPTKAERQFRMKLSEVGIP